MVAEKNQFHAMRAIIHEETRSIKDELETKIADFKSETFDRLDKILKEVKISREEQIVLGHRVDTHDKRLNRVENELQLEPISEAL